MDTDFDFFMFRFFSKFVEKVGVDYQPFIAFFHIFMIFYILFFFDKMCSNLNSEGLGQNILGGSFSGPLVLFIFFQVFNTVIDRGIYILNANIKVHT